MAGPATWQFVVGDLKTGAQIGEITDSFERQIVRVLSGPSTAQFKIYATHPLLATLLTSELNLKCYRNGTLLFHGPIISAELAADDPSATPTVAFVAADPSWRFDHRIAGKSASGTLFNGTDRLSAAESLINQANTDNNLLQINTPGNTCGSTGVYIAGPYKKLSECIADLGNTLNGFDWYIKPTEYTGGVGGQIGTFWGAATLGSRKDAVVFEYQGRANARNPNYKRTMDSIANKVYSIPDDGPSSALGVRSATDATSVSTRGLYEDVVDTSGITNSTLRDAVLNDHILYRKQPRQVLTFTPDFDDGSGRVPAYGIDYEIGDTVRARVLYDDTVIVDGFVRLYRMQFDIDDNNTETLTPTVVNEA